MAEKTEIADSLWQSTSEAFETTVMLPVNRKDEALSLNSDSVVMGSITFTGALLGILSVKCDCDSARKVARSMMMLEDDDPLESDEIEDALGEVANLVVGGLKSRIMEKFGEIEISVPTVVSGKEVHVATGRTAEKIRMTAENGRCKLEMGLIYSEPE